MDIKQIYSAWNKDSLPTSDHIVYFTLTEQTRELDMVALLLKFAEKTVTIKMTEKLAAKIPHVWNDDIVGVVKIESTSTEHDNELRIFLKSKSATFVEVQSEDADDDVAKLTAQLESMTLTSADTLMANKSKSRLRTLAQQSDALVSMDWVRACASHLVVKQEYEEEQLDRERFVLVKRDDTYRHVHHANPSVTAFLKELAREHKDKNGRQLTVTWQFTIADKIESAIHLQKLKAALTQLCPDHWFEFLIFVCAIGLPIHELMKPGDMLSHWKRFSQLNQDNIIKLLLRPRFKTTVSDIEINELLRKYNDKENDFHERTSYPTIRTPETIDQYFFKSFYGYPSVKEIEQLWGRIQSNAREWKGT